MALTTHQINQAYVSVLGRAAIGTEIAKAAEAESVNALAASLITEQQAAAKLVPAKNEVDVSTFSSLDSDVILNSKGASSTEFVENLYSTFLNRGSDEEGLAYWKGVLAAGATKEEVVSAFKAAIISQAAEGTEDYTAYQEAVAAKANAFLEYLYQTDLGRAADEDGLAYWAGEIAKGASYAQIIEAFTAAVEAQGAKTDDGVAFANKLAIADHASEKLQAFSKTATAANIKAAKENIKDQIANINGDSSEDNMASATENIDEIANTYKAQGSKSFTTKDDDKLGISEDGEYNTSAATNFTGTYNVADETKGTIQKSDAVYGNTAFAKGNVLTVNVAGANADHRDYDLTLPSTIDGVQNLVVKGTGVSVTGSIDAKFSNTVTIEAGYADAEAKAQASNITVDGAIDTYKAGTKADTLTLGEAAKVSNIDLGAGKDALVLTGADISTDIADATDYTTIKSLTSVETISLAVTDADSGAAINYDAIKGNLSFNVTNTSGDGAGVLIIDAGKNTEINTSKIVNGGFDAYGTEQNKIAGITITNVGKDASVKLQSPVDGNKMIDTIQLAANASNVKITNVGIGDGATVSGDYLDLQGILPALAGTGQVQTKAAGTAYVLTKNELTVIDAGKNIGTADAAFTFLKNGGNFAAATANDSALIAFNNGKGSSYLYSYKTANTAVEKDDFKLIAVIDHEVTATDKATSGVIEFTL